MGWKVKNEDVSDLGSALHFPSPARSVGEGGRRPDEGSFSTRARISKAFALQTKSPHPPFGHPLPLSCNGRGVKLETVLERAMDYCKWVLASMSLMTRQE